MQTAMTVLVIIFAGTWLCAYLGLWHSIDNIKDSLEYIKRECNNNYEINQSKYILQELISKTHKELLTEIACLATKNNEDIKRSKEGYKAGDILYYNDIETLVLGRDMWRSDEGDDVQYRMWNLTDGEFYASSLCVERDAKFLRRASLKE